jgi:hypothetical protein
MIVYVYNKHLVRTELQQLVSPGSSWPVGETEAGCERDSESQMSGDKLSASCQLKGSRKVTQRLRAAPGTTLQLTVHYATDSSGFPL